MSAASKPAGRGDVAVSRASAPSSERAATGALEHFDVVVLGGGPGAAAAAGAALAAGRSVALVVAEESPTACEWHSTESGRALLDITRSIHHARTATGPGVRTSVEVDFGEVLASVATGAAEHREDSAPDVLLDDGVEMYSGSVRFLGPDRVAVDGHRLQGRRFVLAGPGICRVPDLPGLADVPYLTSATLWDMRDCPDSLLVLGDGVEACEMAQAFARLGAHVTLLRSEPRLLPRQEPEASRLLSAVLSREGVEIIELPPGSKVSGGRGRIEIESPERVVEGSMLLVAEGCFPDTAGLALELPGVAVDETGRVLVDDRMRSVSAPAVYAVGHCAGEHTSPSVADEQSRLAVRNLVWDDRPRRVALPHLDALPGKWHGEQVPALMFTDPQIAWVGLSEAQAADKYGSKARVTIVPLAAVDRGRSSTDGFVKLVAAPGLMGAKTLLRLVGMTVVGPEAGEMLAAGTLAIRAGVPLSRLASTLAPSGTWSGAVRLAASLFFAEQDGLRDRPAVRV